MSLQLPDNTNIRYLLSNSAETATLTVTPSSVADQGIDNLFFVGSYKVLVVPATAFVLKAVWAADQSINTVVIDKHNLTSTATVVFELVASGGAIIASKTFTTIQKCLSWCIDVNSPYTTVRKIKITITDDDNTDLYLKVNRFAAGIALVPVYNIQTGASLQYVDTGISERAKSGAFTVFPGNIYREIKVSMDFVSMTERNYWASFFRNMGIRASIYISVYPNSTDIGMEQDHEGFFHLDGSIPVLTHQFIGEFSLSLDLSDSELLI